MLTGVIPFSKRQSLGPPLKCPRDGRPRLPPRKLNPELSAQAEENCSASAAARILLNRYASGPPPWKAEIDTVDQVRVHRPGLTRLHEPTPWASELLPASPGFLAVGFCSPLWSLDFPSAVALLLPPAWWARHRCDFRIQLSLCFGNGPWPPRIKSLTQAGRLEFGSPPVSPRFLPPTPFFHRYQYPRLFIFKPGVSSADKPAKTVS